jgi:two-component system, NarL family, sensor kinase
MPQSQEIYIVIIVGIILGLLLVGFIVAQLFLHKQKQKEQQQELDKVKDNYEKEALRSQLEIQENTFKMISQELHDNIGQMLSVVKLSLSALPMEKTHPAYDLTLQSRKILDKAIIDLSDLTKSLHTERIRDLGLVESLKFELNSIKNTGLIETEFIVMGTESPLPEQTAIFLFRIIQEIINNILKHAKASKIKVSILFTENNLVILEAEDNGTGFDYKEKQSSSQGNKGVGLKSIFNRALLIGAQINIESEKDKGTKFRISLPIE